MSNDNKKVISLLGSTLGGSGLVKVLEMEARFKGTINEGLEYAALHKKRPAIQFFVSSARDIAMDGVMPETQRRAGLCDDELADLEETLAEINFNPETLAVKSYCPNTSWGKKVQDSFAEYLLSGDPESRNAFVKQVKLEVKKTRKREEREQITLDGYEFDDDDRPGYSPFAGMEL